MSDQSCCTSPIFGFFQVELTSRRCLQKKNIFPAIVFGKLFENLQFFLSIEASGMGNESISMKAKGRKLWDISKKHS
jgi:hypothetical protein